MPADSVRAHTGDGWEREQHEKTRDLGSEAPGASTVMTEHAHALGARTSRPPAGLLVFHYVLHV